MDIKILVIGLAVVIVVLMFAPKNLFGGAGAIFGMGENAVNKAVGGFEGLDITKYYDGITENIVTSVEAVPAHPALSGECKISQEEQDAFQQYLEYVKKGIVESEMRRTLQGTGFIPEALLAAVLTTESRWNPKAVGPCGDGGIAQFQWKTARDMGLEFNYEKYGTHPCVIGGKTLQCSGCSKCNPSYASVCELANDPRYKPELAIPAAAKYLNQVLSTCKGVVPREKFVAIGVSAYNQGPNGGKCDKINTNYIKLVVDHYYPQWHACLKAKGYVEA
ncbi:transglycosylase SLT domain-containing protein [Candidatus Woesearchaeota archaeon]|nr:transglycosylase SLT domain-containing protein [Candidatus Woesearchaeota archaeon]